jgi:hypothetical protein
LHDNADLTKFHHVCSNIYYTRCYGAVPSCKMCHVAVTCRRIQEFSALIRSHSQILLSLLNVINIATSIINGYNCTLYMSAAGVDRIQQQLNRADATVRKLVSSPHIHTWREESVGAIVLKIIGV